MPLLPQKEILPYLAEKYREDYERALASEGDAGERNGMKRVPVLVDFENSVVERPETPHAEVASKVERHDYRGPIKFVKRIMSPLKEETVQNVANFVSLLKQKSDRPTILVVGGGSVGVGMDTLYSDPSIDIVSFDIYPSSNVQFVGDAHDIPLNADMFDGVVIQAVLEHVLEPAQVVSEIWRVLKPGGLVYAETPFMQQVHEGPYDFTRFTDSGHRYLFRRFKCLGSGSNGGPGIQFMWSVDYLFRGLFRSRIAGKFAKLSVFWVQYLDRLIPERYRVDGASGTFFLGAKLASGIGPKDAVAHYRGAQISRH